MTPTSPPRQPQQPSQHHHNDRHHHAATPLLPNFCSNCGSANMSIRIPPNDERPRACCDDCGAVVYVNPKVVVSTVVLVSKEDDEKDNLQCLMAKRAIEPRKGYWGIPQGFMELGETTRQAAVREVYEETGAVLDAASLCLRAVYNVPGSVQLVYQTAIQPRKELNIAIQTMESTDIGFFDVNQLPDICFPTVQWAIDHCLKVAISSSSSSSAGLSNHPIQQKTKFYDAATETWSEYEDEVV